MVLGGKDGGKARTTRRSNSYVPASRLGIANLLGNAASTDAEAMMSIHALPPPAAAVSVSGDIMAQRGGGRCCAWSLARTAKD